MNRSNSTPTITKLPVILDSCVLFPMYLRDRSVRKIYRRRAPTWSVFPAEVGARHQLCLYLSAKFIAAVPLPLGII